MSREEYMTELGTLLQNMPAEERAEALQYYNDYFDEAGAENEAKVMGELGSPQTLADTILAGTPVEEEGEFRETGYTDTRFEQRETPAQRGTIEKTQRASSGPRTNNTLKIVLIVLIVLVAAPVVLPVALGLIAAVFGILVGVIATFFGLAVAGFAVAVSGVVVFALGIGQCFHNLPLGVGMLGTGLILTVAGIIISVLIVKLCCVIFPPMFRGTVNLFRKPFQKREVAN